MRKIPIAALLPAALTIGCGSVSTAPLSAMQACADVAQAMCAKRASCTKGAGITRVNGDMDTCLAEERQLCTLVLSAADTGQTPDGMERCAGGYDSASCTDFLNGIPPVACTPAGSRAVDAPCAFNGQCQSAFCARAKSSACGMCASPPSVGDPCLDGNCAHGQTCLGGNNTCQAIVAAGQPCDGPTCSGGDNCVGNDVLNMGPGTCEMAASVVGAACGAGTAGCAGVVGLACGGTAGSKTCMMMTYATDGAACGMTSDGGRVACLAGVCYTTTGVAGEQQTGTCKADVGAGMGCDIMLGPACKPPGRCVVSASSTAGTCTIPDPAQCG